MRKDVNFRGNQVGVTSVLFDSSEKRLDLKDNVNLTFGDDGDLKLYHNGSHSYITDTGTGDLKIGEKEFEKRRKKIKLQKSKFNSGVVKKYINSVSSASEGCITD